MWHARHLLQSSCTASLQARADLIEAEVKFIKARKAGCNPGLDGSCEVATIQIKFLHSGNSSEHLAEASTAGAAQQRDL